MILYPAIGGLPLVLALTMARLPLADNDESTVVFSVDAIESAAATDDLSASLDAPQSINETAAATDAFSETLVAATSLTESAAATDATSATLAAAPAVTESAAATDATSATLAAAPAVTESAAATDATSATLAAAPAVTESAAATDATSVTLAAAALVQELAAATDATSATLAAAPAVTESAAATDATSATLAAAPAVTESAAATDATSATLAAATLVQELAAATDATSATLAAAASVAEFSTALYTPSATLAAAHAVFESSTAADDAAAIAIATLTIDESASALFTTFNTLAANVTATEFAHAVDSYSVSGPTPPPPDGGFVLVNGKLTMVSALSNTQAPGRWVSLVSATGQSEQMNTGLIDSANYLPFSPAVPSYWGPTPPTQVAGALNQLVTPLAASQSNPVPLSAPDSITIVSDPITPARSGVFLVWVTCNFTLDAEDVVTLVLKADAGSVNPPEQTLEQTEVCNLQNCSQSTVLMAGANLNNTLPHSFQVTITTQTPGVNVSAAAGNIKFLYQEL